VNGDQISIEAGLFDENIDLYKAVSLTGAGMALTTVNGTFKTAVSLSGVRTLNSNVVTFSGGTTGLKKGRVVSGTGIATNARIASVSSNSITLSANVTSAGTSAVIMAQQSDACIRVRGDGLNSIISGIKFIGHNGPNPESPSVEYATIYFRNLGLGSSPSTNWEMKNCELVAAGEYAILTDAASGVSNININNCKISGQTFLGSNPSSGNQFSVANVPRQLVTIQSANTGVMRFMNNTVMGVTGGLTTLGAASFNTAVTIDAPNSIVTGNTINGTHGYGYALRVRGAGSTAGSNINYSLPSNANSGFLIGPTGSQVSGINIGTNTSIVALLVTASQAQAGSYVSIAFDKTQLKAISSVLGDAIFSQESNWNIVGVVYKKDSKRMTCGFKDFAESKSMKLGSGLSGETFQLHKIIISKSDRTLKVVKREEISGASSFDVILK
jgi:hypothetical protein